MKTVHWIILSIAFLLATWFIYQTRDSQPRIDTTIDLNWRFILGDPIGASEPRFNDSEWRYVSLPHDWMIEQPVQENNPSGTAGGYYPEGGGQVGDQGIISFGQHEVKVTNAKKQDGAIRHLVDGDFQFEVGTSVKGILDWGRRYECMRFHTAQHILSRYLQLHYGAITVGNQITPGKSRADFSPLESFDESMKVEVENGVNKILSQDNDVIIKFMPRTDAIEFLGSRGYQVRYPAQYSPDTASTGSRVG